MPAIKFCCIKPKREGKIDELQGIVGKSILPGGLDMDKKKVEYFKNKLLKARQQILNSGVLNNFEDLHIKSDDLADDADLANNTINQQISFSLRDKESNKLRRIDAALGRVEDGSYGYCLESGDPIEEKRLEIQPWAEFCIEVAEEHEREQHQKFNRHA